MSFVFETICDDFLVIFKLRPAKCALEIRGDTSRAACVKFFFRLECEGKQSISRIFSPKSRCKQFFDFFFPVLDLGFFVLKKKRGLWYDGVALRAQLHLFSVSVFNFEHSRFDWIFGKKKNLVQNVPMKQNFFSKFARNVKIKTTRVEGKQTKQTEKAFVS